MDTQVISSGDTRLAGYVELMEQVEALRAENARLRFIAYHDALTGLPNRLLFQDRLEHALILAQRMDHQVALLFIDVDHFKSINDSFGHEAGDQVLREVARRLGSRLRKADTLARMSGDEFLVLLENVTGPAKVDKVVQKIRQSLTAGFRVGGREIRLSVTIGSSLFPQHAHDTDGLLRCADRSLLIAKQHRRGSHYLATEFISASGILSAAG